MTNKPIELEIQCQVCYAYTAPVYIRHTEYGVSICDTCEWTNFVEYCLTTVRRVLELSNNEERTMTERPYPETERRQEYEKYSDSQLAQALLTAQEALERTNALAADGFTFDGRMGPEWRQADVRLLSKMRGERATETMTLTGVRMIDLSVIK